MYPRPLNFEEPDLRYAFTRRRHAMKMRRSISERVWAEGLLSHAGCFIWQNGERVPLWNKCEPVARGYRPVLKPARTHRTAPGTFRNNLLGDLVPDPRDQPSALIPDVRVRWEPSVVPKKRREPELLPRCASCGNRDVTVFWHWVSTTERYCAACFTNWCSDLRALPDAGKREVAVNLWGTGMADRAGVADIFATSQRTVQGWIEDHLYGGPEIDDAINRVFCDSQAAD